MNITKQALWLLPIAALAFSMNAKADGITLQMSPKIVNIDSSKYGYNSRDGAVVGNTYSLTGYDDHFMSNYQLLPVTLEAGTYTWTNAAGTPDALYSGYSFRLGSTSYAWDFAAFDATTNELVFTGGVPQQDNADTSLTLGLTGTFTLLEKTTLNFTVLDYHLVDNAGGVSLAISAVPEADAYAMMLAGLGLVGFAARRRFS